MGRPPTRTFTMELPAHQLCMTVLMTPDERRRRAAAELRKTLRRGMEQRFAAIR